MANLCVASMCRGLVRGDARRWGSTSGGGVRAGIPNTPDDSKGMWAMPYDLNTRAKARQFSRTRLRTQLAFAGVALAAGVGAVAYFGGWFRPEAPLPVRIVDRFEEIGGIHPGF